MLQIDKAILATTRVQPGKLSLGESEKGPVTRELEIENSGETPVTYDFSFINALSTEGVLTVVDFWESNASVAFSVPSITVPRHGEKKIKVTITAPTTDWTPDQGQYGGYIVITPRNGGQVVHVPFAGFVGDYQSIQVLTQPYGLPLLTDQYYDETITTFTLANGDLPYVLAHFEHQARQFKLDVYDVNGKFRGNIFTEEYWGRNSTTTSFFAFPWDGTLTKNGKAVVAPDGQYTIKLSVLKALGNSKNPADWETWTSPLFTIDRP
jgi:minor extracellular serine protease Vpr